MFEIGARFQSWNDFAECFETFLNNSYEPIFVISDSRSAENMNKKYPESPLPLDIGYYYCIFKCAHGFFNTSERPKNKQVVHYCQPYQKTLKKGCESFISICYSEKTRVL